MTIDPVSAGAPNLVERAKNILMKPQAEWERIEPEAAEVNKLYVGYALPLAALAAIASFIGTSLIGTSMLGVSYRVPIVTGLIGAVLQVCAVLLGIFVMAMVTNALAPTFGSVQNQGQAHKLAVYGATAALLGGLFAIVPPLAILGLLAAIYSLVLIYIGLPRLMKTPEDKRIAYFATIVVVSIVIGFVINLVLGSILMSTGALRGAPSYSFGQNAPGSAQGEITLPGGGTINVGDLERQAAALQGGAAAAIDPARVQAQLPQSLPGGFALVSSSSSSAMGMSQAEAVYRSGDAEMRLTVAQTGAMGAFASMAAGMNVQESRQDSDGYARTQTIEGRIYSEEVNAAAGSASYSVIGRGVAVTAQGTNITLDQARAAVDTIGVQRLEREFGA